MQTKTWATRQSMTAHSNRMILVDDLFALDSGHREALCRIHQNAGALACRNGLLINEIVVMVAHVRSVDDKLIVFHMPQPSTPGRQALPEWIRGAVVFRYHALSVDAFACTFFRNALWMCFISVSTGMHSFGSNQSLCFRLHYTVSGCWAIVSSLGVTPVGLSLRI